MNTFKQHRACRAERVGSAVPAGVSVARLTPCRYSVRQAIRDYRHIQNDDGNQISSAMVQVFG